MTDDQAFDEYPELRHWYDKLWVATQLGYLAGIEQVPCAGHYIVRPIMNLQGCGIGAKIKFYLNNETIPDNCFWSQIFHGDHVTIDYTRVNGVWQQGHTFQGFNSPDDLVHFSRWTRVDYKFMLPGIFKEITAPHINIEIIGDKIIEVHLRHNTDPVMHDEFIPIWSNDQACPTGYVRISDPEDHIDRLGFFVKPYTS
jgi:hypothetical protein